MSEQLDLIRELADLINRRQAIDLTRFFTESFRLDDPGSGALRFGLDGAARMIDAIQALAPDVRLDILDSVEDADRVAIRWSVTWSKEGAAASAAMLAIYRFIDGRIADDWGVSAPGTWR